MLFVSLASLSFCSLAIVCASAISLLCFKWWQMHPLYGKNVGPPVLPFVGSFFSLVRNQHRNYDWATQLLLNSPSLTIRNVLFGIELYTTANPANVEHMLKTNFRNYTKGFRFQSLMQDMLGHGIFNADGELWKAQRKAASYEFTSNSLKTLMLETVQKEVFERLLPVLYARMNTSSCSTCGPSYNRHGSSENTCATSCGTCGSSCKRCDPSQCHDAGAHDGKQRPLCMHQTPIDLQDIFLRFAFDNVCQISLGVDPACLNHALAQNQGFAKAFDDATELIIQRFFAPAFIWKLKKFLNVGSERKLKEALHIVHSFAMDVIRKRKEECKAFMKDGTKIHQQTDLLARLLGVAAQLKDGESNDELRSKVSEDEDTYTSAFGNEQAEMKSDELLRDMIISFLLAGRDTSSIALSWFFWLLVLHPTVEAAIYEEIMRIVKDRQKSECTDVKEHDAFDINPDAHGHAHGLSVGKPAHKDTYATDVGDGHINAHDMDVDKSGRVNDTRVHDESNDGAHVRRDAHSHDTGEGDVNADGSFLHYEPFTYKELQEMKYLQAALQETMRLYPPVPHDTKLVVKGEILPDGTRVRSGAQVAYHAYAMGRMQSLWGKDCEKFRPERWFAKGREGAEGGLVNESPFKWPVFQAGPRICLGKDMAMLQMKCVAAVLIERFTFSLPATFSAPPSYSLSFTLKMQHGLPLLLHPRR